MESRGKRVIRNVLLGFVLVSIGFIAGKEVTRMRLQRANVENAGSPAASGDKVVVYYMHQTIRCVTCNKIEQLAHSAVHGTFSKQLEEGTIQWEAVNIDEREDLASRYKVSGSTVVVVQVRNGKVDAFKSLDEVWTLVNSEPEFIAYVTREIRSYLGEETS